MEPGGLEAGADAFDAAGPGDASTADPSPMDATARDGGSRADGTPGADAASAGSDPCRPFDAPSPDTLFASQRRVFAHYFHPFPLSLDDAEAASDYYNTNYLRPSGEGGKWTAQGGFLRQRPLPVAVGAKGTYKLDNMKREIALAMAGGITGFMFDVMGVNQANAGSELLMMLEAAAAVDARFKIVVMPDLSALANADAAVEASQVQKIIESVASSPASYRLADGRIVVSSFYAEGRPASWWRSIFSALEAKKINVAFVPVFLDLSSNSSAFAPISYGLSLWGTATPGGARAVRALPAQAHAAGAIFMAPILSQQYRPKDFLFWEAGNSAAFRESWGSAIGGGADWAQIVTFNDFSESGQITPYTDATLSETIGTGYYDLNAYYASWFLTGQAPAITHDVLYYVYRREPTNAAAPAQSSATKVTGGTAAQNDVELVAFLTAPGTLRITLGGKTFTKEAPAGLTTMTAPQHPGTPVFALARGGADVFSFEGGVDIVGAAGLPSGVLDLTYWSGSASAAGTCARRIP
jgi:hypothetical protein